MKKQGDRVAYRLGLVHILEIQIGAIIPVRHVERGIYFGTEQNRQALSQNHSNSTATAPSEP